MKIIKPNEAQMALVLEQFKKETLNRNLDGKVKFEADILKLIGVQNEKREVLFYPKAMEKMRKMVNECAKEIAWHGVVERIEDAYHVKDILFYPQKITAVTVTTDDEKYAKWVMEQPDEIFEKIRLQGHSHVNMGVTPSSVDLAYYEQILNHLNEDDFYIFMIMNKKGQYSFWIHEIFNNIIFEPQDIETGVLLDSETSSDEWYQENFEEYIEDTVITNKIGFNSYETYHRSHKYQAPVNPYLDEEYMYDNYPFAILETPKKKAPAKKKTTTKKTTPVKKKGKLL